MKKSKIACDLKSCFFCTGCLPEWLPAVNVNRKSFRVNKGELLFSEGDAVTGIYFVYEGTVKVHKKWGNEKELIVRFARKGDIVGHRGLGANSVFPVSATALEPSEICFIDLAFFEASMKVNPGFLYKLMMFFATELQLSERKMRNLAHMSVKGRVAQALISLEEKFGKTKEGNIDITLSRQDLSSYAGTTYETVFRILNDLVKDNAIQITGKSIAITHPSLLLSFTNETEN